MICKCGQEMVTKRGNIALFPGFIYGEYTFCPAWKWWQISGHTQGESHPIAYAEGQQ